jgi:hypothetical protein
VLQLNYQVVAIFYAAHYLETTNCTSEAKK